MSHATLDAVPRRMSILDLPAGVLDLVYNSMPVQDRVRFALALPKSHGGIRLRPRDAEKRLFVLSRAIARKRIVSLSPAMKAFLATACSESDPTLAILAQHVPDVRDSVRSVRPQGLAELAHKFTTGTLTDADLRHLPPIVALYTWPLAFALFKAHPASFQVLCRHPPFASKLLANDLQFVFDSFFSNANEAMADWLFLHEGAAVAKRITGLDWDLCKLGEAWKKSFVALVPSLATRGAALRLLLKHIPHSQEELMALWRAYIQHMLIDEALYIEGLMMPMDSEVAL